MILQKRHPHKRDKYVKEHTDYANNHVYLIRGKSHLEQGYKSVTAFIKDFFHDFDPDETLDKYYDGWQKKGHKEYAGKSREEIKKMWEDKGRLASDEGTYMHRQFELFYNLQIADMDKSIAELDNFVAWDRENIAAPYRTEMTIYSAKYKLVGNVDLLALDKEGNFIIVDYKRSEVPNKPAFGKKCKGLLNMPHTNESKHTLQLNIYKQIFEEEYGFKIAGLYNLYIKEDKCVYVPRKILPDIKTIMSHDFSKSKS